MSRSIELATESFEIAGGFAISRGSRTHANVLVATIREGAFSGRGECVPYARYGESLESVAAQIQELASKIEGGLTRQELQEAMPAGAARNALDCALWDLEAKRAGKRAWELAGIAATTSVTTAYTISLGTPQEMAAAAATAMMIFFMNSLLDVCRQGRPVA